MKKVILIILDGWGCKKSPYGNAIQKADPKHFLTLWKQHPHTELCASGEHVGLLKGDIGNSQVGHLHIASGRQVPQDVKRIFDAIHDGSFFTNKVLCEAMQYAKKGHTLHLLGLLSDANVHSNIQHLFALIKMAHQQKVPQVYVHAFLDGRDTPPRSSLKYIHMTERELQKYNKNWKIATITGRYYAMDRDNRWHREHKAYDVMVNCKGYHYQSAEDALHAAYKRGETDEFVKPSLVAGKFCTVRSCDTVIFFNFRSDRARELTHAFVHGRFKGFVRKKITPLFFVCMTQYDPSIKTPLAFPPLSVRNTLGEIVAHKGLRQFRLAETEKWAHVTYFFNGLIGTIFRGEERCLIPSSKVTTYDKQPAMKAHNITHEGIRRMASQKYAFIVINLANPDMVGHTGDFNATVKAIRVVDTCLAELVTTAKKYNYTTIITADHGNAETKLYPDGSIATAHTTNKVPFIIIGDENIKIKKGKNYALYNIAPTVLDLLGIRKPKEMSESIIENTHK